MRTLRSVASPGQSAGIAMTVFCLLLILDLFFNFFAAIMFYHLSNIQIIFV
jgi:hypothetical protein